MTYLQWLAQHFVFSHGLVGYWTGCTANHVVTWFGPGAQHRLPHFCGWPVTPGVFF